MKRAPSLLTPLARSALTDLRARLLKLRLMIYIYKHNYEYTYMHIYISCVSLRTLNYGNDGIFLIMGNAGFISSAV